MPDILQDFPIAVASHRVYEAISSPAGLDQWWTRKAAGAPQLGSHYELGFGPQHQWRAVVTVAQPPERFELRMLAAHEDWQNTRVGFELEPTATGTQVRFYHRGWPETNEHYRISVHCWAMYLRVLRRYLEHGEIVPYEQRLEV